jgi:hypothetical protein
MNHYQESLMKHILATSILCVTVGLVAAGCAGSSTPSASPSASAPAGGGQAQGAGRGGAPGSGQVTEVSGSTAQVQGNNAQVAVTWTGSTTFTTQVSTDASAVTVGSCVTVTSDQQSGATPSATSITAAAVRVTKATGGTCAGPGGGGQGGAGRPANGASPGGARPSGAPGGQRGGFAFGQVTAVSSSGFTVSSTQPGSNGGSATKVAVTTSGSTKYTTTKAGTAADVKTGVCVTSRGQADDTGAITATTIAVTQPVNGQCGGFGGGGGRS